MPYVVCANRAQYDDLIDDLVRRIRENENVDGDSNYVISRILNGAFKPTGGWRYAAIARCYGCFLAAAAEFYRRIATPYEIECASRNGDLEEYKGLI